MRNVLTIGVIFSIMLLPWFIGGLYYAATGDRDAEQTWLDHAIAELKTIETNDPQLREVLNYTIQRYNQVGPWNVMFFPCITYPGWHTYGRNNLLVPGITLDTGLLCQPPQDWAFVLVHEALHDYPPYFGHGYITPVMKKLAEATGKECW